MPRIINSPIIKPCLVILCLFCALMTFAQKSVDVLFSPVSSLGSTSAKVSSINTLSDSIVFVQVDIIPTVDFDNLPNGISPQTVLKAGNSFYPMNNVAPIMPDSMFPLQNPDGFQGWHDAKANNVYHLLLTFIVPTLNSVESISIIPSVQGESTSDQGYYSFEGIKLSTAATAKAFSTSTLKSTTLLSQPSSKAKKLLKLKKGESICIIEGNAGNDAYDASNTQNSKNELTGFYHVVVLSSGISGYVAKNALSEQREPVELLTDVVKLSKQGTDKDRQSEVAEIEFHNNMMNPVTITINDANLTADPLKTQTFRIRVGNGLEKDNSKLEDKSNSNSNSNSTSDDSDYQYFVVNTEGLLPLIVRCKLTAGDSYHWEYVRATSL